MEWVSSNEITPAEYNPRYLSDDARENLKGSLSDLGFILPIIVNRESKTIVAGHQRTKTAATVGITSYPCYYIDKHVSITDEIRFNQLHNGTEGEPDEHGFTKRKFREGFYDDVPLQAFKRGGLIPTYAKDICSLLMKFGNVFCAIVCGDEVVLGNSYLSACFSLNMSVNISVIDGSKRPLFDKWFSKEYGVFNYDHISKQDFVQGLAQPSRHGEMKCSVLYRELVVPYLQDKPQSLRILDFGCGKGLSLNYIRTELGYTNAIGVEFFNHNRVSIDISRGHKMIDRMLRDVERHGQFDVVICDAVINSVNCKEAEDAVWNCLNLFCKKGGIIFFSGRLREMMESEAKMKKNVSTDFSSNYFDKDGFTGFLKEGQWFFQRFHRKEEIDSIVAEKGWQVEFKKNTGYFFRGVRKTREYDSETNRKALEYEFDLKLPNGQSYGRQADAIAAFGIK